MRRWPQPPARVPQPARLPPSTAALIGEGFDPPFGGFAGETTVDAPPAADAPRAPQPLRIEPPPWAGREADPAALAAISEPVADTMNALDAIKAADGYDPPAPNLDPPVVLAPLVRFKPPAPDWRAELAEREAK